MPELLLLIRGHFRKCATRSCDFEYRVVAESVLAAGFSGDRAIAATLHLQEQFAIWGGNAQRCAELS